MSTSARWPSSSRRSLTNRPEREAGVRSTGLASEFHSEGTNPVSTSSCPRPFIAENDDVSTVVCAPVYREFLGLSTEVVVGPDDGLPMDCSIRCDFLALLFKSKLTSYVCELGRARLSEPRQRTRPCPGYREAVSRHCRTQSPERCGAHVLVETLQAPTRKCRRASRGRDRSRAATRSATVGS